MESQPPFGTFEPATVELKFITIWHDTVWCLVHLIVNNI